MTTIGYATLQIIPSLKGVSDSINKQLTSMPEMGKGAGKQLGSGIAAGVRGSEAQLSAALSQAVNARGGEKAGQQWADSTASSMAKHLQSAQNSQKLQSSLTYLVKNGDAAGKAFAQDMASKLAIELPVQTRAQQIGEKVGTVIGKGIGGGIKLGIAGVAGATALAVGGIGIALKKGFDRLESIDQATFKLKALGHSGDETKQIMDDALSAVKGTAFNMGDAANIAASAVAAGVKPGRDLAKYLTDVADAAAVSGTDLASMGDVMNNVSTLNAAYNDSLQILAQRGLPIYDWLSKATGKTTADVKQLASEGKISAETFRQAIETNIGGAAQKMGQSFDGAVQNMEASVARLGANFITAILGGDPANALGGPTQAIANLTTKFDEIGQWVNDHRGEIHGFFIDVRDVAVEVGGAVRNIGTWLVDNKGAAETLAGVFVAWKVIGAVAGVVGSLRTMSGLLRTTLPADAEAGAGGISKALSLIVIPELGKQLTDQIDQWLADNHPDLNRLNHTNTPGDLGLKARAWADSTFPNLNALPGTAPGVPAVIGVAPGAAVAPPSPTGSADNPLLNPFLIPKKKGGGQLVGPGTGTSDSILLRGSTGEFIVNADDTRKNLPLLEIINSGKLPGFAGGGLVTGDQQLRKIIMDRFGISDIGGYRPADKYGEHSTGRALDVMVGADKSKGDAVKDFALANASAIDLKWAIWRQHLYYPGGGGYDMPDRGSPTQNHMDHVHIFSGMGITNGLRGALAGGPGAGTAAGVGAPGAAGGPGAEDTSSSDQTATAVSATASGGGGSLPSSLSGLAAFGLNGLGTGVGTLNSGKDLSDFGNAGGTAVSGQVSSALGVFGVNDSPGWLKAATQLVGGLKVGGHDPSGVSDGSIFNGANPLGGLFGQGSAGSSAAPLSARPTGTGTPPPDNAGNVHGTRAGQAPGPQVVYNIAARDTEDAFIRAQRQERERAAAKLSRF